MHFCKQCCTFIDQRSRADTKASKEVAQKIGLATTTQQRLAKSILNEQELNKDEAGRVFKLLMAKLEGEYASRTTMSSTEI